MFIFRERGMYERGRMPISVSSLRLCLTLLNGTFPVTKSLWTTNSQNRTFKTDTTGIMTLLPAKSSTSMHPAWDSRHQRTRLSYVHGSYLPTSAADWCLLDVAISHHASCRRNGREHTLEGCADAPERTTIANQVRCACRQVKVSTTH